MPDRVDIYMLFRYDIHSIPCRRACRDKTILSPKRHWEYSWLWARQSLPRQDSSKWRPNYWERASQADGARETLVRALDIYFLLVPSLGRRCARTRTHTVVKSYIKKWELYPLISFILSMEYVNDGHLDFISSWKKWVDENFLFWHITFLRHHRRAWTRKGCVINYDRVYLSDTKKRRLSFSFGFVSSIEYHEYIIKCTFSRFAIIFYWHDHVKSSNRFCTLLYWETKSRNGPLERTNKWTNILKS